MEKTVLFDLEQNRKRLNYYFHLKEKSGSEGVSAFDKWIEIYSERMQKLEFRAQQLGIKTRSSLEKEPLLQLS